MENQPKNISDLPTILKRRKWSLIIPAVAVFLLIAVIAFLIPPIYQSTSTILIEEQEIPRDFVISAVTSFAEQRLQTINQRIMSTSRLLEIINRFNLYPELRDKWTTEEIVDKMRRKDIKMEPISVDIVDRRTGRPTAAVIAFTLSYKGKDPAKVQQVANVLASLYLEENLKVRERQAEGTTKFLEDEMKKTKVHLDELEARIVPYKTKHVAELPEVLQINMQMLDRVERDLDRSTNELRSLKERESYLQAQIAALPPDATSNDKSLLKELRAKLVQLRSRYSEKYPDVVKVKTEIAELEKRIESGGSDAKQLDRSDNPAYVTLTSQLASVRSDIESTRRISEELIQKRNFYRDKIEMTPKVEEGYKSLMVDRNNTQAKYDDLMRKYMEARVSSGLEKEQMGERFTLIDPARLPEKPVVPNIPVLLLIGVVLGMGAGMGTAAFREFSDASVRSPEDLTRETEFAVLASIPIIVLPEEQARSKRRIYKAAVGIVLAAISLVVLFHFVVMDLDVFWAKLMRRLVI